MRVKTFVGRDFREVLSSVKNEFGRSAVILHTRCFKTGGILGFWARNMVEITASDDVRIPPRLGLVAAAEFAAPSARPAAEAPAPARSRELTEIAEQVRAVREMVERLASARDLPESYDLPESLRSALAELMNAEVSSRSAAELVRAVNGSLTGDESADPQKVRSRLTAEIARRIRVSGPIGVSRGQRRVLALIGPTGVGKTTTIAKLAAAFKFQNLDVGLVTMDSYRIAAVDQLRTYAEILDVPLNVVLTPAEFASSLQKMRSKDVVLVDTAGRSQRDRLKMSELRAFIEAGRPDEVHLVVSATTTRSGLAEVIERFSTVLHDRLILTKLDEAPALGPVLDLLLPGNLALSYMTTGQRVPDDIEPAEPQRVARLIMGVETVHE